MQFVYLIILMIAIVEACAQFCLKKGSDNKNHFLYCIGFISYAFIGFLLLKSYSYKGVGYCNLIWSALSIIFACISGKIFFGEKINYLAVLLTLAAIYVVNQNDV
jgi:multidrug transporter EmrE-like cation transporter